MPPYGGRLSGSTVCPFRRGVASSEAETFCSLEGRLATLERGGGARRSRGLRRGALERGEDHPAGPRGCGRAVLRTWAACWASSGPFLSSRLEGGCLPSWARLPSMRLCFQGDFSPLNRVPLIMVSDNEDVTSIRDKKKQWAHFYIRPSQLAHLYTQGLFSFQNFLIKNITSDV